MLYYLFQTLFFFLNLNKKKFLKNFSGFFLKKKNLVIFNVKMKTKNPIVKKLIKKSSITEFEKIAKKKKEEIRKRMENAMTDITEIIYNCDVDEKKKKFY